MKKLFWMGLPIIANYYLKTKAITLKKNELMRIFKGIALNLFGYMLGLCTVFILLIGCFFYFAQLPNFFTAALWTALMALLSGVAVKLLGDRLLHRHSVS